MDNLNKILLNKLSVLGFFVFFAISAGLYLDITKSYNDYKINTLRIGEVLADNFESTVLFESHSDYEQIIKKINFSDEFISMALYFKNNQLFVKTGKLLSLDKTASGVNVIENEIFVKVPINRRNKQIGTLVFSKQIDDLRESVFIRMMIFFLSLIIIIASFIVFSRNISDSIVGPINQLESNIKSIIDGEAFVGSISTGEVKEIHDLGKSFNSLIIKVDKYQNDLEKLNLSLESKIQEQTKELTEALSNTKKFQKKIISQQKLASLGGLTAGIAHEIKNPLNFINNFAKIAKSNAQSIVSEVNKILENMEESKTKVNLAEDLDDLEKACDLILENGQKTDNIIKSMLVQARTGRTKKDYIDLSLVCKRSLDLSYHAMKSKNKMIDVEIKENIEGSVFLSCFGDEIERALINLLDNSFDSLREKKSHTVGFIPQITLSLVTEKDNILITVSDNGVGIQNEIIEKIKEPFFTTKAAGEGTGLGMSMINDIVLALNGELIITSEPGEHTEIKLIIPRIQDIKIDKNISKVS